MRPLSSLRSRVFLAMAAAAVLPVAGALLLVTRQLLRQAEGELQRGIAEASRVVERSHRARRELLAERAALLADLPKLKAAVSEADARTVEPVARDYQARVRSSAFMVADRNGRILVALGVRASHWPAVAAGHFLVDEQRLIETVAVPIALGADAEELLGHLALGFVLDDAFAAGLRDLSGSEVAILHAGRVHASTLPRELDDSLLAAGLGEGATWLGAERYAARRVPLAQGDGVPFAVVLRSRSDALRPLRTLQRALLLAAFAAVAAGVLASWALARTVTRPLAALTAGMREIAATGDLARPLPPAQPWDDEDARVLASTFGRLTDSIGRFQRERATRDRLSALGQLSTVIAHEVRNPLMIIKGSLRALKPPGGGEAEREEALADIDQQVRRLDRIVADVLDFARPLRLDPGSVDVGQLAREAAAAVLGEEAGRTLRLDLDGAAGELVTDGERLRAVLVNLIENARQAVAGRADTAGAQRDSAAEAGAASAAPIEVGARRLPSGGLRLWVADEGEGIPEQDLPHVFEPYFTTKRTGTGLGLAIARRVVEALEGSIRMDSRRGQGTRVEIELPPRLSAAAQEAR